MLICEAKRPIIDFNYRLMRKNLSFLVFIITLLLCSCEDKATDAKVSGVLIAGEGVEEADLVGVSVYLHAASGVFISGCVDSVTCKADNTFDFEEVAFGSYVVSLGNDYVLSPIPKAIILSEDHASEKVEYEVTLAAE